MERFIRLLVFTVFLAPSLQAVAAESRPGYCDKPGTFGIVGEQDNRARLWERGPRIGLTADEITQIRRATGYLICETQDNLPVEAQTNNQTDKKKDDKPKGLFYTSTAFLVGNSTVVTVAHQFFGAHGVRRTTNGEWKCYFRPQLGPWYNHEQRYDVIPSSFVFGNTKPRENEEYDYAVMNLVRPVAGARPLPFTDSPVLRLGEVFAVSAYRAAEYDVPPVGKPRKDHHNEPLVQKCNIRKLIPGYPNVMPSRFYSDCDNTLGGSGGPVLARENGKLMVIGMHIASGGAPNCRPYNDVLEAHYYKQFEFPGEIYVGEGSEGKCADGKPGSVIVKSHRAFDLVRYNCEDLNGTRAVPIGQNYQIDPKKPDAILYQNIKYKLHPSSRPVERRGLSMAVALHIDLTFLTDVTAVLRRSSVIGMPAGQPAVTAQAPRQATRPTQGNDVPSGSSGFLLED